MENDAFVSSVAVADKKLLDHFPNKYSGEACGIQKGYNIWQALQYLACDIEYLAIKGIATPDESAEFIRLLPDGGDKIADAIDIRSINKALIIRQDFASALRSVKRGRDLSGILDYGFSNSDLIQLGRLHKSNKFRKKIEDLLEDCNFHTEREFLSAHNYDGYFSFLQKSGKAK